MVRGTGSEPAPGRNVEIVGGEEILGRKFNALYTPRSRSKVYVVYGMDSKPMLCGPEWSYAVF